MFSNTITKRLRIRTNMSNSNTSRPMFESLLGLGLNGHKLKEIDIYWQLRFKIRPADKALEYFDTIYSAVFNEKWEQMKIALLAEGKYATILNNFTETDNILRKLKQLGAYDVGAFYRTKQQSKAGNICLGSVVTENQSQRNELPLLTENISSMEDINMNKNGQDSEYELGVKRIKEVVPIRWPPNLKIYAFHNVIDPRIPSFKPSPSHSISSHYMVNSSSILPVIALDLQDGDKVLDMCAGPGGKSLAIIQTLMPGMLVCNDILFNRLKRVKLAFNHFIPKELNSVWERIIFNLSPGNMINKENFFDKVLVDSPCLHDRLTIQKFDKNRFNSLMIRNRTEMPHIQANLILSALKTVKPGGAVVYSTCTLSPLQNEGSVHLALRRVTSETDMECTVVDMVKTMKNLSFIYNIGHDLGLRYGHLVLPFPDNNCGPMYVCKIIRDR